MTAATPTPGVGGALEGLNDLLECSVCLEPLGSEHRVLPCQHTFCLPCLEDLVAKKKPKSVANTEGGVTVLFLCPECRAEVTTPIQNLPTNVILNRLLSGLNQSGPSPKATPTHAPPPAQIKRVPPPPLAIGDHRKLPFPTPKSDNNNIPGNFTKSKIPNYARKRRFFLKVFTRKI